MPYLGIDIGKHEHEAGILNDDGSHRGNSLRFANTTEGFGQLTRFIETRIDDVSSPRIGMEATGHYWLALYSFLHQQGHSVTVINPIQSDSLRSFHIRQTKTDTVDCFLIAEVLRFGNYPETQLVDEDMVALRNLARFRTSVVDACADTKRQVISLLDQVFPEYEKLFSDVFGKSSRAFLKACCTPDQCLEIHTKTLAALLRKASRGRYGTQKARELKNAAGSSCGLRLSLDAFSFQIRLLIEQIDFTESQIGKIDLQIRQRLEKLNEVILTIPGVGPANGAVILGEIGDIHRFPDPKKLVAFAGIDPSVMQSGNFTGTHNRMSKRGSPYLRRAIWSAAVVAAQHDPVFKAFYEKKRREGKAYGTAIGAVARKLIYTIYAVLKSNKPYEVRPSPDS